MSRFKPKLEKDINKTINDLTEHRSKILADFAAAYMIENDVPPSRIRLVEKQMPDMVSWHFEMLPDDNQNK